MPAAASSTSRRKYSEIDSGAINFNAAIALADAAAFLGAPAFYEDPNEQHVSLHQQRQAANEQENLNLSLKGDWDLGVRDADGIRRIQRSGELLPD